MTWPEKKRWQLCVTVKWNYSNLDYFSYVNRRRQWQPTPVLLPGESHGWRSLVGCSPWGRTESDITEQLYFHFSLSCLGEGNGNPLQCSCLENPRDGGAWWASVYGVSQSRTQLKRLSSKSSSYVNHYLSVVYHGISINVYRYLLGLKFHIFSIGLSSVPFLL